MFRNLFRTCAAIALLWMAWSRSMAAESCSNNSYCEWHIFQNDFCASSAGATHCEMTDTHECFTGDGNCIKVN